ncbi:hypothetical protein LJ707_12925 [Mucilaginibacter sp. UR6-1]|uniref:hypothetical protein n=1 Tax=Mucilaginibacter sp. UR6-1 TaxID=1435643 RepID=UPI001E600186|nr:hypothetical protein [Mucilaginibacter sp. UR6-1]MCC8409833.1 hypothetical protein [Mucilaginibacter sp. UR6-1]
MNELLPYAYGGAVILILILIFDIRQRRKFNTILKQSNGVEPLLMKQTAATKLNKLQNVLSAVQSANTALYNKVSQKLDETMHDYNTGKMPLPEYTNRLDLILNYINKHAKR